MRRLRWREMYGRPYPERREGERGEAREGDGKMEDG